MTTRLKFLTIISLTAGISAQAVLIHAQGCSDAGFCTIGNLAQENSDSLSKSPAWTLLLPVGVGDEDVIVFSPGLQFDKRLSARWSMQIKITANHASGNLGKATGPGDFYVSATYQIKKTSSWHPSITLGTKLPLNSGNLKASGTPLPMSYQSSLGTIDFIAGIGISNERWQFAAGWQQPLSGANKNRFLPDQWDNARADNYPPSYDFNRQGDVLLRVDRKINAARSLSLNVGLLGIYHLGEDTYVDTRLRDTPILLDGAEGMTLNATLAAAWAIREKFSLGFSSGVPLLFRDLRPDGLTRKFVFAPEIRWKF
ncbi:MAG TPA: hypothetical protein VD816_16095 [Ohtaekwangia sp.]|nr:hypothetical protein [Ohtaekwangia sp.]